MPSGTVPASAADVRWLSLSYPYVHRALVPGPETAIESVRPDGASTAVSLMVWPPATMVRVDALPWAS